MFSQRSFLNRCEMFGEKRSAAFDIELRPLRVSKRERVRTVPHRSGDSRVGTSRRQDSGTQLPSVFGGKSRGDRISRREMPRTLAARHRPDRTHRKGGGAKRSDSRSPPCPRGKDRRFCKAGDSSIIVLNVARTSTSRWIFDVAHEMGHFVLHVGRETGSKETEAQANSFASALLLPRKTFSREFRAKSFSWAHVFELKRRCLRAQAPSFGVRMILCFSDRSSIYLPALLPAHVNSRLA